MNERGYRKGKGKGLEGNGMECGTSDETSSVVWVC